MMNAIKEIAIGLAVGTMLGGSVFMASPASPMWQSSHPLVCQEDEGCWDAETMGNGYPGPDWDCETMGNGICELGKIPD